VRIDPDFVGVFVQLDAVERMLISAGLPRSQSLPYRFRQTSNGRS
jgi:hypothetical protein